MGPCPYNLDMEYNEAIQFLRQKFLDDNKGLLKKYEKYKATGTHTGNALDFFREHDVFDMLSVLEKGMFLDPTLFATFEELLFVAQNIGYRKATFHVQDYLEGTTVDQESLSKDMKETADILEALDVVESRLKEDLKSLGVKVKDPDSEWYDELLKAVHRGKGRELKLKGDEEFLVSKIRGNGKGFVFSDNMRIDNRIFYTDTPEHIIEMARVSKPGVYIIASIPKGDLHRSGFYVLFVSEGDSFLVDNNMHVCRGFVTRSPDRLLERRAEGAWFPWMVINNFIEKKSDSKAVALADSKFSFRSIGKLSEAHPVEVMWIRAFIDTCLQIFRDSDITEKASPAVSMGIIKPSLLDDKTVRALVPYTKDLPTLKKADLEWRPRVIGCDSRGTKNILEPLLKDVAVPDRPSDTLMPLGEVRRQLMWAKRNEQAEKLGKQLRSSWEKKKEKAIKQVSDFVRSRFHSNMDYWLERSFEDKKYPVKVFRQPFQKPSKDMDSHGGWFEDQQVFVEHAERTYVNIYRNVIRLKEWDHRFSHHYGCECCDKKGRFTFSLTFHSADQFALFFEIKEGEKKRLPKEFWEHFHQEQTRYDGNPILNDLDPLEGVVNPWWVSGLARGRESPTITIAFYLCGFCRRKLYKKVGRECPKPRQKEY